MAWDAAQCSASQPKLPAMPQHDDFTVDTLSPGIQPSTVCTGVKASKDF